MARRTKAAKAAASSTLTTDEAAKLLNVTRRMVSTMVRNREITPVEKSAKGFRFRRADVEAIAQARSGYSARGGVREGAGRKPSGESPLERPGAVKKIEADTQHRQLQNAILADRLKKAKGSVYDADAVRLALAERLDTSRRVLEDAVETMTTKVAAELGLEAEAEGSVRSILQANVADVIHTLASIRFDSLKDGSSESES